jgi:hypothetical protein
METFLEILKYILPSLVVFITAYYILKVYLDSRLKNETLEMRRKDQEIILPLRLQAYERMILFLERISPVQVVFRVKRPEMSPAQMQHAIIQSIREEYEHNIAQQIYISSESWNLVRNAREEIVRLVNTAFISMTENSTSNELAQKIVEDWGKLEKNPAQVAVDQLKKEVARFFE